MAVHTAHIENWARMGPCLRGNITKHSLREFNPACQQITSELVSLNEHTGVAETLNTRYTLGIKGREFL